MKNFEGQPQSTSQQETPKVKKPETEITLEQKEILKSATKFAEYLTSRWPQVDTVRKPVVEIDDEGTTIELSELPKNIETETRINYYLCGSLACMLLSLAESFTEMDETQIPALVEARTREIPESAREILASFARQIGDLDYVPMDHYKTNPTRLKKGGGGPSFDEVPEAGRKVLKRSEDQIMVMCDPCVALGARRIAKINIDGQDYYIAGPDTIIPYKVLHVLLNYEQKPEKFNTDFEKLYRALRTMYREEELVEITQQVLKHYENAMERLHIRMNKGKENPPAYKSEVPESIERVLANQQVSPEIRAMLEKLREQK